MIIKQYERAIILCGWASKPEVGRPRHPDENISFVDTIFWW
jgi:hypothetical protein